MWIDFYPQYRTREDPFTAGRATNVASCPSRRLSKLDIRTPLRRKQLDAGLLTRKNAREVTAHDEVSASAEQK